MNKINTRVFIGFVVVLAAVCVTSTFASGAAETAPESTAVDRLTLLYPRAVASIPVLALIEDYADDYAGEFFTDHPQALAQLVSGQIDVLATGFTVGYNRYRSAGDVAHLMTPVWGVSALMTAQPVDTIADLAGGVVYAPFEGSPIDVYLNAVLAEAGVRDAVQIAYAPFPQAAGLLAQGQADAAMLVEPIASRLELSGAAYRLENMQDGWSRIADGDARSPQVSLFVVDRSRLEAYRVLVERLTPIVQSIAEDPGSYARRFAAVLDVPAPVLEHALANSLFEAPSPRQTADAVATYTQIMGLELPESDFYAFER